jgi:hypothetical protein
MCVAFDLLSVLECSLTGLSTLIVGDIYYWGQCQLQQPLTINHFSTKAKKKEKKKTSIFLRGFKLANSLTSTCELSNHTLQST